MTLTAVREYVHRELDEEVAAIGGRYTLTTEARLLLGGREVLYLLGWAAFDTTCCGAGGCSYALVPGFIVEWKTRRSIEGREVSLVEPVLDSGSQAAVRHVIEEKETVQQVIFL